MPDLPDIGTTVHATIADAECLPLYVHAHMTPTHLALADVPPSVERDAPQPTRTLFAVASDTREPGTWHTAHD